MITNFSLAHSYVLKATKRLKALKVLFDEEAYSDVIREAQEIVELALKGMLRQIGVEPPKQHDVGNLILEFKDKWPADTAQRTERLAKISKWLRKEREFSFYGDVDFIPTLEYSKEDAQRALKDAAFAVTEAQKVIPLE